MNKLLEIPLFIACVGLPYIGGILGSLAIARNMEWFDKLEKPIFNPPFWVFGVAWGIMYGLIGLASYFVVRNRQYGKRLILPIIVYLVHLALNWSWPPVFFGLEQIESGIGIIVAVFITALFTAISFGMISKTAAFLFIPYLQWLIFAMALNISFAVLNPAQARYQ
ncbi:hypothetical protein ACTXT7_001600 [Hymenolepis weldensis]